MKIIIKGVANEAGTEPKGDVLKRTNKTIFKPENDKVVDKKALSLAFDSPSRTDRSESTAHAESHKESSKIRRTGLDGITSKYSLKAYEGTAKTLNSELDPSLYLYDEYVDEDTVEKETTKFTYLGYAPDKTDDPSGKDNDKTESKPRAKEPQYMAKILNTARKRKIEREIALDKKLLEDELADNGTVGEVFVTDAYKKKLEERKQFELEQQRRNRFDALHSETSLSNFHKYLLNSGIAKRSTKTSK